MRGYEQARRCARLRIPLSGRLQAGRGKSRRFVRASERGRVHFEGGPRRYLKTGAAITIPMSWLEVGQGFRSKGFEAQRAGGNGHKCLMIRRLSWAL